MTRTILGVGFFRGTVIQAVDRMMSGGLVVVPAAPALRTIDQDLEYRRALLSADCVIPDSSYMVMIWKLLEHDELPRISGLAYLRELLQRPQLQGPTASFWVMGSSSSAERNLEWLRAHKIDVPDANVYVAPLYGRGELKDDDLLQILDRLRPNHIVITIGGGTQERLGLYLRENLSYRPSIHCIGAAIAFLSGDQVKIPVWADRMYLGWLLRVLHEPFRYGPRYVAALGLFQLLMRNRSEAPAIVR